MALTSKPKISNYKFDIRKENRESIHDNNVARIKRSFTTARPQTTSRMSPGSKFKLLKLKRSTSLPLQLLLKGVGTTVGANRL